MDTNNSYLSRVINIGQLALGGREPVRIQSMTNMPGMDTEATVRQVSGLHLMGCELVRIAAKNAAEVENLAVIREKLEKAGIFIPLAADIHFNPKLAEKAASVVHKIRINPGNYIDRQYYLTKDRKSNDTGDHAERIREAIGRLTGICRRHGTVIRVGVNHGSLSERIMLKYGNTAEGMVASALEFLEICRELDFHDLVVSLKSSDINTMIDANLQLVRLMKLRRMDYPIHLGVTEAGEGEDGRVRSAAGIGPLLAQGIGDTIRVSLTEDPIKEIPVAKTLISLYKAGKTGPAEAGFPVNLTRTHRASGIATGPLGGEQPIAVISSSGKEIPSPIPADLLADKDNTLTGMKGEKYEYTVLSDADSLKEYLANGNKAGQGNILLLTCDDGKLQGPEKMFSMLAASAYRSPIVVKMAYREPDPERLLLRAASDLSVLILKNQGDAYWLTNDGGEGFVSYPGLVFSILQSTGKRITGTGYISCPGCGRTEFDIQKALKLVKAHTGGLKNIKIAVMGCIVNGPGEMAGADYGYVGSGAGRISLYYRGKMVKKGIPEKDALKELLELIEKTKKE
jgi:(E)-4-hydroxy-3-methylbut-2-enyl-diphosphate synthase